jgi:uncharacterized small protein (DUF1192 family)
MEPDDLPARTPDLVAQLAREDLDRLSVAELTARVEALEAEIARARAKMAAAVNTRASADALFRS